MKKFVKKVWANIRPLFQIVFLCAIFLMICKLDVTSIVLKSPELTASQNYMDYIFYFAWSYGNEALGVFLTILALIQIRKSNKDYQFNKGATYKNYPYIWYLFCSKILGYSKCNLILVPIYMQFKLIINDTFDSYYCGEYVQKNNDSISLTKTNFSNILGENEMNLIVSDTYPLSETQLPSSKKEKPTILISRDNMQDYNRYDSPNLVSMIVNEIRELPLGIKKINIVATTNPKNTMNIVQNAFKLDERGNLELIMVYQQMSIGNPRPFKKKGKVVYKK